MIWHRWRKRSRDIIRGSGALTVTDVAATTSIDAGGLGVFGRLREPFDDLPVEVAQRIRQEHPAPDELAFDSSRRLLADDGDEGNLALYAVPMSSHGVVYALSDESMQPQFVTRLRYGYYSVAQEYRVSAGERFDIYTYGLMLDNVEQIFVSVGEQEYLARLGENGYCLSHQAIGELPRIRAIRCVLADGETTYKEFGPNPDGPYDA